MGCKCVQAWAETKPLGLCSGQGAALVSRSARGMMGALPVSVGAKTSEIKLVPRKRGGCLDGAALPAPLGRSGMVMPKPSRE